ncbi:MAG: hypothetical protein A2719_04890 [Candidatus Ryanbacteria bacterium RIFCSPHIGHO2_01_FULL_45_22]|uniref:RNA polymerase sigma-70 region 4 domain-containing protein n=1 Tax=Candidatus Ryanbacteria bacterium RIFCSPHIGHO2_01_FULL_45_22 TaxID=1802114 RepID=A0A1G2G1Y0_9BACT|nr:MAG: hypothetical protein A2719_04890 [Candidatus Ryanbacteria bacterium RIFCSPHIGHO2_01_FULL_45_22]
MAEKMTDQELDELTQKVLATLTPREKQILAMRFGIQGDKGEIEMQMQEIGRRFEETHKRVREIEEKALRKIRRTK